MRPTFLLLASIASIALPAAGIASDRFWDINNEAPGAGGTSPSGFWEDPNWTLSEAGTTSGTFWDSADTAVFAAGTNATGEYTVTLNATEFATGLSVQEGAVSLAGSGLNIAAGTVTIESGAKLSIPSTLNLVATPGAQLILNGGTLRNTTNGAGSTFADADFTINVGAAGGTVEVTNTGSNSTIFLGTLAGAGNTLTKTGPGEFRFQGPTMANSTFSKLVVNQGLYRLGFVSGNTFETGFGAVPAAFTPDAITLSGGGSIGTSWNAVDSVLHVNRGITLGAGGGALLGNLTVPGAITGPGSLSTTTTIILTGANNFTGPTIINSGSLALGSTTAASGALLNSSSVTVNNATLSLVYTAGNADRLSSTIPVILNGANAQISLSANAAADTSETIGALSLASGSNIVSVGSAAGRVTTLTATTFSRGTNNATALFRGTGLAQDTATNVARITLPDAGATLNLVGSATLNNAAPADATQALKIVPYLFGDTTAGGTGSGFVTYDSTLGFRVLNAAQTVSLSAGYSTAASPDNAFVDSSLVFSNAFILNSLLFKTAASTITGATPVLLTVNSGAIGTVGAFDYTIAGGFSGLTLGNGEGVITVSANTLTISTPISVTANGGLTKAGAGTLTLTAANSYTGGTRINAGVLQTNHAQATGTGPVAIYGTRFAINSGLNITNAISIGPNLGVAGRGLIEPLAGTATVSGPISITSNALAGGHFSAPVGTTLIVAGAISAPPAVTVTSRLGNVTFSGGGTYSALQIQAGAVNIGADNGISTAAILDVASSDPGTFDLNGFNQTLAGLARTSGTALRDALVTNSGVPKTLTLNVTTSAAYAGTIAAASAVANATITGNLSLVKDGPGTQSFSGNGANTYSGSTVINAGTLKLQKAANIDVIPAGNSVTINSGGTLLLAQSGLINDSITAFTINGGTFDLGAFIEGVTPPLTLTNATITGTSAGFLLTRGGFNATGTNTISKSISVRGDDPSSGNFAIASGTTTVSGAIYTDNGNTQGISKTGAGTLVLSGSNAYNGPTVVKAGTTIVKGSLAGSSAVTVGDSGNLAAVATLGGSGFVGDLTATGSGFAATSGAAVSPGNSVDVAGILNTGAFSVTAGAHLVLEIGGAGAGGEVAAGYDQIAAAGAVTLTGGDLKLTMQGTPPFAFGTTLYLIANNGFSPVTGTFATVNGSAFNPSNIVLNGLRFQLTYTAKFTGTNSDNLANDVALVLVPEPGAWLAMLSGLGVLAVRRPRANRRKA